MLSSRDSSEAFTVTTLPETVKLPSIVTLPPTSSSSSMLKLVNLPEDQVNSAFPTYPELSLEGITLPVTMLVSILLCIVSILVLAPSIPAIRSLTEVLDPASRALILVSKEFHVLYKFAVTVIYVE